MTRRPPPQQREQEEGTHRAHASPLQHPTSQAPPMQQRFWRGGEQLEHRMRFFVADRRRVLSGVRINTHDDAHLPQLCPAEVARTMCKEASSSTHVGLLCTKPCSADTVEDESPLATTLGRRLRSHGRQGSLKSMQTIPEANADDTCVKKICICCLNQKVILYGTVRQHERTCITARQPMQAHTDAPAYPRTRQSSGRRSA